MHTRKEPLCGQESPPSYRFASTPLPPPHPFQTYTVQSWVEHSLYVKARVDEKLIIEESEVEAGTLKIALQMQQEAKEIQDLNSTRSEI